MSRQAFLPLLWVFLATPVLGAQGVTETPLGEAVERHLSSDEPVALWAQDPAVLKSETGDRLETREVLADEVETVKLRNVIPPIRFESGVADIPPGYIETLRDTLAEMAHLDNVRLHVIGHADNQPLSDRLVGVFGDNAGLSRERAGEVAEFIQAALGLPPEAISFEWAGDTRPVATNATEAGKAQNRRVEVEVWYDQTHVRPALEEVLVPETFTRVKVCRVETVCKLRYMEGHQRRARVRNLVPPLHFDDDTVGVPEAFIGQIDQALHNLGDKSNVTVKFIGFSDNAPLAGRAASIYGTHLSLTKARARRVALAVQEALSLPSAAVASDGRGAESPLASNETARGRALNRRIEVEFWHDDPLQELPDEPQLCPDAAGAELVTRVYDPPWGDIPALQLEGGRAIVPPGYVEDLRTALAEVADRTHPRLRFIGYTANERLDRRTALIYGDDVGLSTARARRAMETVSEALGLEPGQAEHEGHGYVQSADVVNAGFIQGEDSYVAVQVVYDELAVLDDYEGVDVTRLTRELRPQNPLGLNLMRITVDGEPVDDPERSSADVQRCTDVALDRADIRFRFDNLASERRLSVTAQPAAVPFRPAPEEGTAASLVRFRMYTNYGHFIDRAEIRLFEPGQSPQSAPLEVIEVHPDGYAEWQPGARWFAAPVRELSFVLRAYDDAGRFDETAPQSLWMVYEDPAEQEASAEASGQSSAEASGESSGETPGEAAVEVSDIMEDTGPPPSGETLTADAGGAPAEDRELLAGYGESDLAVSNIPLGSGTVTVSGGGIPPGHAVWVAGRPVPVDPEGRFVAETILPTGMHTVEVAVLDDEGNGELFLRDLELERDDWFYVGVADLTLSSGGGTPGVLQGDNAPYDDGSAADGRLAFFVTGKFRDSWHLTASADTREAPLDELFTNFMDKSPDSLFRRIDPDYHYPTFGDDGTVEETAPTQGKLYVKLHQNENHALWGNFKIGYGGNELARVDRGLYGGNLHYQSPETTGFGEQRFAVDGFAAEPGTLPSREEFRGTGGSLYFLRHQDILTGSERVYIEVRDKDTGIVDGVVGLSPGLDYDIDHLQGRILLSEPLASTVDDSLLVRTGGLSGDEAWLVVHYEFTPGFDELDALAVGGQAHYWVNDSLRLGLTSSNNEEGDSDSSLNAADVTLRMSAESWLKLQTSRSEGLVSDGFTSADGGFAFQPASGTGFTEADAGAYRADVSVGMGDFIDGSRGRLSLYVQNLEAGYSAPGLATTRDTEQYGGVFSLPVTDRMQLDFKADRSVQDEGLEVSAQELDLRYRLDERWSLSTGIRNDLREDDSAVVPLTQEEGERTDAVVQVAYDSRARWSSYGFAQGTLATSGEREDNNRFGTGGAYRLSERLMLEAEVSDGDLGPGGKLGTRYQRSDRTSLYLTYALENESTEAGAYGRRGNLIAGLRTRLSDSASVYAEERYQQTDTMTGLTHANGFTLTPSERWSFGANSDIGTLVDRDTGAETKRQAGGVRVGYGFETVQLASAVEYRFDETEQLEGGWSDRTTWLYRNTLKYQITPDWRLVGKLNYSDSESSMGQFYDGGYTEAVLGYAYRPVEHDRLNVLTKYTYFYNVPTTDQVVLRDTAVEFIQKSHVAAVDINYDLTPSWSVGGKYAYRLGQVSVDREDPEFFDNNAHLYVLRTDLRFRQHWEGLVEGRMLDLPDLDERRAGALVAVYRYLGDHFKVGVGYNFTDFSEDLTDLSYDEQGVFLNVVGAM